MAEKKLGLYSLSADSKSQWERVEKEVLSI